MQISKEGDITVIYADILLMIDFCMDMLSLSLMLKLTSRKSSFPRVCLSATVGSIYSLIDTLLFFPRIVSFFMSLAVSFVMVYISCGKGAGVKFYAKYTAVLWGAAALLGGFMTLVCSLGDGMTPVSSRGKSTLFLISVSVFMAVFFIRFLFSTPSCSSANVTFFVAGSKVEVEAFVDNGNMLKDPISALPVVFLNFAPVRDARFLPLVLKEGIQDGHIELKKRLRIVPARRAGQDVLLHGVLCEVVSAEKSTRAVCVFEKVESYGGYAALVPPSVV